MGLVFAVKHRQIQCSGDAHELQAELTYCVFYGESGDVDCVLKHVEPGSEGLSVFLRERRNRFKAII